MSSQTIELSESVCNDLLKRYLDVGYSKGGVVPIKVGATLHKYYRIIKGIEEDKEITKTQAYNMIFKFIEAANNNKAYTLDDVSVIDSVFTYLNENVISVQEVTTTSVTRKV
ncbi:MAG TPA: hypothetical protein V6C58_26660 [Allocoleopsis sp.]